MEDSRFLLKNAVSWDVTPVALVRTDVSEELIPSIIRMTRIGGLRGLLAVTSNIVVLRSVLQLLFTANVATNSPIFVTLIMKAKCSSETLLLTRATRRNIPEGDILYSLDFHHDDECSAFSENFIQLILNYNFQINFYNFRVR
jgi:hypothetical protein